MPWLCYCSGCRSADKSLRKRCQSRGLRCLQVSPFAQGADTAETNWQRLLLPGGGWVEPPCCSPGAKLSCQPHTATHTLERGDSPLSTETQQGHFQFNGPSHLWIHCLSIAAESTPTPPRPTLLPCLVRFLSHSNVQRDRTAKGWQKDA